MNKEKVVGGCLWRKGWLIDGPKETLNDEGNIVLLLERSFGPVEYYEWGITKNDTFYQKYQYLENDFYSNEIEYKEIPIEKLLNKLKSVVEYTSDTQFFHWKEIYEKLLNKYITSFPWNEEFSKT